MKDSSLKSNFQDISSSTERDTLENLQKKTNFSSKAVNNTMPEQLIIPPARVWDKIEKILDEQDNRRKNANHLIATSFGLNSPNFKRKKVYLATVAGLSVVAGLMWIIL
ncbi:MAG: hypothetical protein JWQ09_2260 [Segetibacter sp.]|nr:hypothetical protein [Segetibacter sp.]